MLITWDERKREADLAEHGFDFVDFEFAFGFDHFAVAPANPDKDGRARRTLIGQWNGTLVVTAIAAALGSEAISLISLRPASKKEKRVYDRL